MCRVMNVYTVVLVATPLVREHEIGTLLLRTMSNECVCVCVFECTSIVENHVLSFD